jgi:hypothetical protein
VKNLEKGIFVVWDQRVAGSNPATPTNEKALHVSAGLFYLQQTQSLLEFDANKKDHNERSE